MSIGVLLPHCAEPFDAPGGTHPISPGGQERAGYAGRRTLRHRPVATGSATNMLRWTGATAGRLPAGE
ncbi:MAG: hypothetical protein L0K27_00590, partial [Corynebacterium nuruki]|nr:hypothetical protein [Corynebacterium nuruki]